MAMSRIQVVCDGPSTLSFVLRDDLSAVSDGVTNAKVDHTELVSFTDVLGNRISIVPDRVIAILAEPVSPEDEEEMRAEIGTRQAG